MERGANAPSLRWDSRDCTTVGCTIGHFSTSLWRFQMELFLLVSLSAGTKTTLQQSAQHIQTGICQAFFGFFLLLLISWITFPSLSIRGYAVGGDQAFQVDCWCHSINVILNNPLATAEDRRLYSSVRIAVEWLFRSLPRPSSISRWQTV